MAPTIPHIALPVLSQIALTIQWFSGLFTPLDLVFVSHLTVQVGVFTVAGVILLILLAVYAPKLIKYQGFKYKRDSTRSRYLSLYFPQAIVSCVLVAAVRCGREAITSHISPAPRNNGIDLCHGSSNLHKAIFLCNLPLDTSSVDLSLLDLSLRCIGWPFSIILGLSAIRFVKFIFHNRSFLVRLDPIFFQWLSAVVITASHTVIFSAMSSVEALRLTILGMTVTWAYGLCMALLMYGVLKFSRTKSDASSHASATSRIFPWRRQSLINPQGEPYYSGPNTDQYTKRIPRARAARDKTKGIDAFTNPAGPCDGHCSTSTETKIIIRALQGELRRMQDTIAEKDWSIKSGAAALTRLQAELDSMHLLIREKDRLLEEQNATSLRLSVDVNRARHVITRLNSLVHDQDVMISGLAVHCKPAGHTIACAEKASSEPNGRFLCFEDDIKSGHKRLQPTSKEAPSEVVTSCMPTHEAISKVVNGSVNDSDICDLSAIIDGANSTVNEKARLTGERIAVINDIKAKVDACQAKETIIVGLIQEKSTLQNKLDHLGDKLASRDLAHQSALKDLITAAAESKQFKKIILSKDAEIKNQWNEMQNCKKQLEDTKADLEKCEITAYSDHQQMIKIESDLYSLQAEVTVLKRQISLKDDEIQRLVEESHQCRLQPQADDSSTIPWPAKDQHVCSDAVHSVRNLFRSLWRDGQFSKSMDNSDSDSIANAFDEWNTILEEAGLMPKATHQDAWTEYDVDLTLTEAGSISVLRDEVDFYRHQNKILNEEVGNTRKGFSAARSHIKELHDKLDDQRSRLILVQNALDMCTDERRTWRLAALATWRTRNAEIANELKQRAELKKQRNEISTLILANKTLHDQIDALQNNLESQCLEAQCASAAFEDRVQKLSTELDATLKERDQDISALTIANNSLRRQLKALKGNLKAERLEAHSAKAGFKNHVQKLRKEFDTILKEGSKERSRFMIANQTLREQFEALEGSLEFQRLEALFTNAAQEDRIEKLMTALDATSARNSDLISEGETLMLRLKEREEEIVVLTAQKDASDQDLRQTVVALEKALSDQVTLKERLSEVALFLAQNAPIDTLFPIPPLNNSFATSLPGASSLLLPHAPATPQLVAQPQFALDIPPSDASCSFSRGAYVHKPLRPSSLRPPLANISANLPAANDRPESYDISELYDASESYVLESTGDCENSAHADMLC
ncbi:hypothetical protein AcW2_006081 [Taiwanofungus camphoratus]|nr:hypothetical protein AcW2_006081 [Antrodia cinnamomea]